MMNKWQMNGILLTFTLILSYSRISCAGAPLFFCFPNVLPVASEALLTTLVILPAAFEAFFTASETILATSKAHHPVAPIIDVGGGPSGPSIEGPFCRTVHLCRTLEDRKMGKKGEKKKENNEKERKKRKKNRKK